MFQIYLTIHKNSFFILVIIYSLEDLLLTFIPKEVNHLNNIVVIKRNNGILAHAEPNTNPNLSRGLYFKNDALIFINLGETLYFTSYTPFVVFYK